MKRLLLSVLAASVIVLGACGGQEPAAGKAGAADEPHEHHEHEHEHEHEAGAAPRQIKLAAKQIQAAGIRVAEAGPAAIRETLPVYGIIAPNAERVRDVAARFPGVIRSLPRKIGDSVRQGEALATIESNESLQTYAVVAPLSGVVIARNGNAGEQSGDKVLFTIADLSTVWVELSLFPRDLSKVRVGQSVRVKSSDIELSGEGQIVYVAPFGTSSNQTLTARVQLDNPERRWAPGLYVTAEIALKESQVPLAIRPEALQTLEQRSVVFVKNAAGFEPRTVRLGRSDGQWVEVADGISAGETYAVVNSFILKAELGKGTAEHDH